MTVSASTARQLERDFGVVTGAAAVRRLSDRTRSLAARALSGEFGLPLKEAEFTIDTENASALPPNRRYALAVKTIAKHASLRLVEGELLVGAATLKEAVCHRTPVINSPGTSHTTVGFEKLLQVGLDGYRKHITQRLAGGNLDDKALDLLTGMLDCLDALDIWHGRYVQLLQQRIDESSGSQRHEYSQMLEVFRRVPNQPPSSFREAVQSLWFTYAFLRLCGIWSGLGRLDKMLGPFLQADLAAGTITLDQARELVAHFWIKGCEWVGCDNRWGSGDAQFYQNVILGGIEEQGREVTNPVTFLVLDVVEELHISDFPIAVRVSSRTSDDLWRKIATVQQRGGGIVAIYNEDLVIRALTRFGYPLEEARNFTNDGCWETLIPGRTAFTYWPFDVLELLQQTLGLGDSAQGIDFATFGELYRDFVRRLEARLAPVYRDLGTAWREVNEAADMAGAWEARATLVSIFVEDCIASGRSYNDRGPKYNVFAPHAGGLPDTANSLLAIRKLVYEDKTLTLPQLREILRNDWRNHEPLRLRLHSTLTLYGNDDEQADAMLRRVYDSYTEITNAHARGQGVLCPPGISTFGREIEWRAHRLATAFGRHKGEILATHLAPTPGSDRRGPTAMINSFCSMDFEKLPNGVPLELKLLPSSVAGSTGAAALVSLMKTFVRCGGMYLHIDVVDSDLLRDAQNNPQKYPNLVVRIAGWSARFATLAKDWQDMIIQRSQHSLS